MQNQTIEVTIDDRSTTFADLRHSLLKAGQGGATVVAVYDYTPAAGSGTRPSRAQESHARAVATQRVNRALEGVRPRPHVRIRVQPAG